MTAVAAAVVVGEKIKCKRYAYRIESGWLSPQGFRFCVLFILLLVEETYLDYCCTRAIASPPDSQALVGSNFCSRTTSDPATDSDGTGTTSGCTLRKLKPFNGASISVVSRINIHLCVRTFPYGHDPIGSLLFAIGYQVQGVLGQGSSRIDTVTFAVADLKEVTLQLLFAKLEGELTISICWNLPLALQCHHPRRAVSQVQPNVPHGH